MNLDFDKKKFSCKFDYCIGKAADLADPSLHAKAQDYKRRVSGSTRAVSSEDAFKIPKSKGYFVSRKYDGEFALLFFDGKKIISVNPGATVRVGLPCLDEAEALLKKAKVKSCVLAGEYYVREGASKAHPVQQVVGILRKPDSKKDLEKLGLAIFDVVQFNDESVTSVAKVFELLDKWCGKGKSVQPVEHRKVDTTDKILEAFTEWVVGEGAEGVVVRHDTAGLFKIKTRHNIDVAIIGFSEGTEDRKGMLHDLLVAVIRDDGTFHEFTRVGGGFTDDDRREFVKMLRKTIVPSDYVAVNNDYVAYEMIKPGPVVEISCLDLISERARGGPVNRMVLEWDGKRYRALSRLPLVSVISPQYVSLREDKEAVVDDVNIRQVSDLVKVPEVDKSAHVEKAEPSDVLERQVHTKTMKGNKMVRKLLLWKTNKDEAEFPPYVVYLTDFSPNRQNPLERDIKIASTEKDARKLFDALAAKNFVSGWEKAN
jgi:ATP-dependent DNA ligase